MKDTPIKFLKKHALEEESIKQKKYIRNKEFALTEIMHSYAGTKLEELEYFINDEICERRDYSASKMCEVILDRLNEIKENEGYSIYVD